MQFRKKNYYITKWVYLWENEWQGKVLRAKRSAQEMIIEHNKYKQGDKNSQNNDSRDDN